jgi:hypothetical protein
MSDDADATDAAPPPVDADDDEEEEEFVDYTGSNNDDDNNNNTTTNNNVATDNSPRRKEIRKSKSAFLFFQGDQLAMVRAELGPTASMGDAMTEVGYLLCREFQD